MLLRVRSTTDQDSAVVTADGEIDLSSVNVLRDAVTTAVQTGVRRLTIDLAGVSYIDSSGLGMLVGAHKRMRAVGGTLTIRCGEKRLLRLFGLTGLDRVLTIRPHQDADLRAATPA